MIEAENVCLITTKLLRQKLPETITVEYLHGKMKGKEKNQIMERFAAGEIQVLVSTTVVEVGVNVPDATVMMIENAERFRPGPASSAAGAGSPGKPSVLLHYGQLLGIQRETQERLDILTESNDGFYIAFEDLKLRGPGDFFGIRQSGDMEFKLADIYTDAGLLKTVSEEVNRMLNEDPTPWRERIYAGFEGASGASLFQSYERLNLFAREN